MKVSSNLALLCTHCFLLVSFTCSLSILARAISHVINRPTGLPFRATPSRFRRAPSRPRARSLQRLPHIERFEPQSFLERSEPPVAVLDVLRCFSNAPSKYGRTKVQGLFVL